MIRTVVVDTVAEIVIDRYEKRNALDIDHLEHLQAAVEESVNAGARALVITGAGGSFCAGADLDGVYGNGFRDALYATLQSITSARVPVIAAVEGHAIGAGAQLAIACDLRVASTSAKFAVPTARNGLAVDQWTVRRLAFLAGGGSATAMLLAAGSLDAETAFTRGLVDRMGGLEAARDLAREIATLAPLALRYSKRALQSTYSAGQWDPALDDEFDSCWASQDFEESKAARAAKRAPRFVGK